MVAQLLEAARHRPAPTHVLQASLTIAANTSETEATRLDALIFVQEMVEDYDVANGTLLDRNPHPACNTLQGSWAIKV